MAIIRIYLNVLVFVGLVDLLLSIFFLVANKNLLTQSGFAQGLSITCLDFVMILLECLQVLFDIKECTWREIYMRRKYCLSYFYHILRVFAFAFPQALPLVVITVFFYFSINLVYARENSPALNIVATVTFVMWTSFIYQCIIKLQVFQL